MAKSREQVLQETLGAMAFQLAIVTADLAAAQEQVAKLRAATADGPPPEEGS